MAITSIGYDGTVDEVQWAKLHPAASSRPSIINVADASIVTGATRTVRMPAGSWYGYGVYDTSDANVDLVGGAVSSGTRWDTLVLRRDWTTNTSTFLLVAGTSTKAISASVQSNPGVVADQPLYLVRFDSALAEAQELSDIREFGRTMMFFSDGASGFPDSTRFLYGQPILGRLGSSLGQDLAVKRSTGWDFLLGRPWSTLSLSGSVVGFSGPIPQWRVIGDVYELRGTFNPSGGGKFTAGTWYTVTTLSASVRPQRTYAFPISAYGLTAASYTARCEVLTDGTVRVKVASDANITEMTLDGIRFSLTA